ncbi:MAG: AsmA-like C-terminal domain-containing protein [Desulfuromonadales bacterium]|nr:AsmA-like C-terminal domain-containing protein [Desulfuromonadales bacterium]
MLKYSYIKVSALLLLFLGAGVIGLALFLPRLIDVNAYRNDIISSLQQTLNRKVSFVHGEFSMHYGPTFVFDNVVVKEPDGKADFLVAKRISIRVALFPLLEKKVVLRNVVLETADMRLERNSGGKLNIDDLLITRPGAYQLQLAKIQIRNGVLHWRDRNVQKQEFLADAQISNLVLDGIRRGHKGSVKLACALPALSGSPGQITLTGSVRLPAEGRPFSETELNMNGDIKQFDHGRFWPYYGRYIPFGPTGGRVDLATSFKGTARDFNAKGKLRLSNVSVNWPTVFHHPVNPHLAQLEYELKRTDNTIDMSALQVSADGLKVKGSCLLQDISSSDVRITAKASSEPFRLEKVRQWIPYGIIADDASRYIEEHIIGGLFRLETGQLDGRVSQITHMEKGTNYNVLRIKGSVDKGIVSYGPKVPSFTNIKTGLDLFGKDFILSRATATFGDSPFKLEGRITDYPLSTPCQYLFQMEMNPRSSEVGWLSRLAGAHKLEYSGGSRLSLRGSGFTSAYNLSGDWDLKLANYTFPGVVRKPVGTRNALTFSATLSPSSTKLNSLSYTLPPLNLSASALLTHGEQPHLGFELQTNQFLLNEALPILSLWQSYRPRGRMQAHIKGSGNPVDFAAMDFGGTIALNSFAFQPGEKLRPVSNINGALTFKGSSLETSNITVHYGSSLVSARGRVRNFKNPEAEITLSSPEFFLRDATTMASSPEASIRRMSASFVIQDGAYTIHNVSGTLKSSNFNISGSYVPGASPAANLSITSPQLDLNELFVLARAGSQGNGGSGMDLKLKLAADSGKLGNVLFNHMNLTLLRDSGVFYIQGLDAALYGGKLAAKGRIAPESGSINRYDLNLNLERVNAERFFQALDVTREVTGSLNVQGNITARGSNMVDIKKSALGNMHLRLEKGKLRKFNVLSKLFSILNFSQLLKFQLPDMVHDGMPYNEIKASVSFRDGTVATQDMFINGDAINISVIGSTDIIKEELNFTIGVQPLQTVDKVVNRIPVLGWLLTGKGKTVVTVFFEAKGKWADPHVNAITVKSMSKGVLNVFRRVFELPVRLFTNTGEVLLGQ